MTTVFHTWRYGRFIEIQRNGFIRKIRLISNFMTSFAIHTLTSISRSKANQAMKFVELINIT